MTFIEELKRRKVFRAGIGYLLVAWVVVQVSDIMLANFQAPGWVFKTIVAILIVGFPLVLMLAWAFEITTGGIHKESKSNQGGLPGRRRGRQLIAVFLVVLSFASVYLIWNTLDYRTDDDQVPVIKGKVIEANEETSMQSPGKDPKSVKPSIAVLPFANRSPEPDSGYFTDGIHDDLLTYLSDNKSLRVISRTSVMRYRDSEKTIPEIARELDVDNVLEGGVQHSGKRVHINVQLIDAATDEHLWAKIYDRELTTDNIFNLQTEIAQAIAAALHGQLSDVSTAKIRPPTTSMRAYDLYLRARELLRGPAGNLDNYRQAQDLLNEAVREDPEYLQAWLSLSLAHDLSFWFGAANLDHHRENAWNAIRKARAIAPEDSRVLAAQGIYAYHIERDFRAALDLISLALAETPNNSLLLFNSGLARRRLGMWDSALDDFKRALEHDPANMLTQIEYTRTLAFSGQQQNSVEYLRQLTRRFPDEIELQVQLAGFELRYNGNSAPGLALLHDKRQPNTVQYRAVILNALWSVGDLQGAVEFLQAHDLSASPRLELIRQIQLAQSFYFLGEEEKAALMATETLEHITTWSRDNEHSKGSVWDILAIAAALAGEHDQVARIHKEANDEMDKEADAVRDNIKRGSLAMALAISGETNRAWAEIKALIDKPNGYTVWNLRLHPGFKIWFGGIPEYQSLVQQ